MKRHIGSTKNLSIIAALALVACTSETDDQPPLRNDDAQEDSEESTDELRLPTSLVPNEKGRDVAAQQYSCTTYPMIGGAYSGFFGIYPQTPEETSMMVTMFGPCHSNIFYAVRVWTRNVPSPANYVAGVEVAYYMPSNNDLLYRSGDYVSTVSANGTDVPSAAVTIGWQYCNAGHALVGIRGGVGSHLDRIGFACKSLSNASAPIQFLPEYGGPGGSAFSYGCDWKTDTHGHFGLITQFDIKRGAWWDGLSVMCERPLY